MLKAASSTPERRAIHREALELFTPCARGEFKAKMLLSLGLLGRADERLTDAELW
ncbi:hypothetical protein ACFOZ0_06110 [Streptomyces yaanensis]|uniref:Uncharacterized protein n=1 Tax=Streptomyces yaanensis TaxID=1142239 RepID=A0ABV7S8L2_9ACTN|nr:hypothetical protein [Streptomyces sp. CGMCC 4.7035]WNC02382.1 hypothetical protein Q2K21_32370 [Streptomyces sp. CGMCC 4.7035]